MGSHSTIFSQEHKFTYINVKRPNINLYIKMLHIQDFLIPNGNTLISMGPNVLIEFVIVCTCHSTATRIFNYIKTKNAKLNTHCNIYTLMHQSMDNKQLTYSVSKLLMVNDWHNFLLTHDELFKLSMDIGYQVPNNMDFSSTMYVLLNLLKTRSIWWLPCLLEVKQKIGRHKTINLPHTLIVGYLAPYLFFLQ